MINAEASEASGSAKQDNPLIFCDQIPVCDSPCDMNKHG